MWLLIVMLWLNTTTGSVYNVTPDDHYYPNTACHHCHNLQHYLFNTTKYFNSNTQLLFLPGLHHLHTDLIIQNVHNISLIGSTTNGTTPDTVIQCNSSVGIVMTNITNLIVTDITVRSCLGNEYNNATILIKQCTNVQLRHVVIEESHNSHGIVGINILGDSHFSYITNNAMIIIYNDTTVGMENHSLTIDHYHINGGSSFLQQKIKFILHQLTYKVIVQLSNSTFQGLKNETALFIDFNNDGVGQNVLLVKHCQFANNNMPSVATRVNCFLYLHTKQKDDTVKFQDCKFFNHQINNNSGIIDIKDGPNIHISHCIFHYNRYSPAITKTAENSVKLKVIITNTVFSSCIAQRLYQFMYLESTELHLQGPIIFFNISNINAVITLYESDLVCSNYIEFSNNSGKTIVKHATYYNNFILVKEGTIINVTHNSFQMFTSIPQHSAVLYYPFCYFQFISGDYSWTNDKYNYNYSIIFDNNFEHFTKFVYKDLPLTHCSWLPQSAFNTTMPLEVNKKYIKYINKSGTFDMLPQHIQQKTLCLCDTENNYDCHKEILNPIFPGQTLFLNIYPNFSGLNSSSAVIIDMRQPTACHVINRSQMMQVAESQNCSKIAYTIPFTGNGWCELFLKGLHDETVKVDIYYVMVMNCPVGFINHNGVCQCSSSLVQFDIRCDIDNETIQRPANAWIAPVFQNSTYYFYVSLLCPFHYCLTRSSNLNLYTPDLQCQFSRSAILCGQCQRGLSTVFGSSHCQQCSNIYLFLIVPIAIAGLLLVLLLFILNLTVTDGTINAFILYVNIISINTPVFFPSINKFSPAYIFVSLANLDLGIQTCFYNGMDDYAKMWLQLAFPFYLIFIATSLIITSRYSTTIQRLTARRALPVLATLFLLSYTKVLLVVSRVMFSYSKIIHLPSRHTITVWSVDANVPLFSVQFITLFMVCSVLFLILIPFNIILLFTRTLSRFTLITKFKPLLDAYQGPYKDKMYYWVGLQLILRIVFFAVSSLDRNINLIICIALFSLIEAVHSAFKPFKKDFKNYHEHRFNVNILILFVVAMFSQDSTNMFAINAIIVLAMAHFCMIVVYHIIAYVPCKVFRNKLQLHFSALVRWITKKQYTHPIQPLRQQSFANRIPEATNYTEYREPLIVQD